MTPDMAEYRREAHAGNVAALTALGASLAVFAGLLLWLVWLVWR